MESQLGTTKLDHKLYFLSRLGSFKIFDFSGEIPQETFHGGVIVNGLELPYRLRRGRLPSNSWHVSATKLVVTVTGDVLKVEKMVRPRSGIRSFRLYKVNMSGSYKRPEQVDSLGEEAMLFDLGITVLVNGSEGVKRSSIYFNMSHKKNPNDEILFNLETQETEKVHEFDVSSFQFSTSQWFLPS
ncbi:hypothetical protein AALP_AA7G048600 [Arabis alpina]|uniref:KIB1-4 beta-propeller domain-containing protein n=1 Tax=Arabis alpina TaxID=50452 RepID=A0A087GFY9_ARAAL|nr:hypothetical protein AALP_AA7G048600 [Arabis alpina]